MAGVLDEGDWAGGVGRQVWRFVVRTVLVAAGLLIALAYGAGCNFSLSVPGPAVLAIGMLLAALGWFFVILVHEGGHALGAKLAGWRIVTFVVLPVALRPRPFSLALIGRASAAVQDAGGWVLPIPNSRAAMTRGLDALIFAGGPVVSLALAVVALRFGIEWSARTAIYVIGEGGPRVGLLLGALGYQSLLAALLTLLPATRAGSMTDGDHLRAIWLKRVPDPGRWAAGLLAAFSAQEGRLRDTPLWLIERARTMQPPVEGLDRWLDSLTISVVLDQPDVDVADVRRRLDDFLAAYGDSEWRATCDAWVAVVYENDAERARAVGWQGPPGETGDQTGLKLAVEAALAARAGNAGEVETLIKAMHRARRHSGEAGHRHFRDAVFDDIATRVRAIPGSPA